MLLCFPQLFTLDGNIYINNGNQYAIPSEIKNTSKILYMHLLLCYKKLKYVQINNNN